VSFKVATGGRLATCYLDASLGRGGAAPADAAGARAAAGACSVGCIRAANRASLALAGCRRARGQLIPRAMPAQRAQHSVAFSCERQSPRN